MQRVPLLLFFLLVLSSPGFCESNALLSFQANPSGMLPLGSSSELFNTGTGGEITSCFFPSDHALLGLEAGAGFYHIPIQSADAIQMISGGVGPKLHLFLGSRVLLSAHGQVGYYSWTPTGWESNKTGGSHLLCGGAGGAFRLTPSLSVGGRVSYSFYNQLYNGVQIGFSFIYDMPLSSFSNRTDTNIDMRPIPLSEKAEGLVIEQLKLNPVFPVLYAHYEKHPFGEVTLMNYEKSAAQNIEVSFYVERYMDNPMKVAQIPILEPGEKKKIQVNSLFTEELMQVTEGTKASAQLSLIYSQAGRETKKEYNPIIVFHNRNALTWDDDRKIAAFVTAKDPHILAFAKKVTNWMQAVKNPAVDENLQKAMILFGALRHYGIRYEIDPTTPFREYSGQETSIDFLQFPRQTLEFTSGDCDDLSALYAALLESVGVETGMVTVPGHIFIAFAIEESTEAARSRYSQLDEFIFRKGKVWVPVEVTLCQEDFLQAWSAGAKQRRENSQRELAQLYPTRSSWHMYQAVGFREATKTINLPDRVTVANSFSKTLSNHVKKEILNKELVLQRQKAKAQKKYVYSNKIAVLYAQHGLYDEALQKFQEIINERNYPPATINSGNIYFLKGEYDEALRYYQDALEQDSQNRTALLGSARCNHEMENYGLSGENYEKLKEIDPQLASNFAYLNFKGEEAHRASELANIGSTVVWEDE